jgi:crotonobetainyl-CoA:carnitine CoA-transferase CaiB-like acyl-CoA transferase
MVAGLQGLRVLDFSRVLAGPFATMLLADFGADVLKVERPGAGDDTRAWGPPYDDTGTASYFLAVNRNKRSIALDLTDADDVRRARELAAEADVVVENFRPGVMERFGLGEAELRRRNRALIYCSITGFGDGAGAALPAYDLVIQALGGLMSITGPADGEPQKVGVAVVDVFAGLFATVGILTALHHRHHTGEGQVVSVDLLCSLLAGLVNQAAAYTTAGVVAGRMGNAHPSIAPYELFAAADGELVLAIGNDRQFGTLCEVLGVPELAADPAYATNERRNLGRLRLRETLERQLARRQVGHWVRELSDAGVPAGAVNDIAGAFDLAERLGLDPIVELPRHDGATVRLPRNPVRLSASPATYRTAPPIESTPASEPWQPRYAPSA